MVGGGGVVRETGPDQMQVVRRGRRGCVIEWESEEVWLIFKEKKGNQKKKKFNVELKKKSRLQHFH